jgi:hypothetical protein
VHQVGRPLVTKQLVFTQLLEGQLVLVSPVNHQQELEQLLFLLPVQQQVVQLQLDCTHRQEQQAGMDSRANLQQDLSFHQEVLPVLEMAIHLFPPFIHI